MTVAAVLAVCWPLLWRRRPARSDNDIAVYRDQLDEIDRDQAASLIGSAEAEAARVEVSRRLIAAAESAKAAGQVAAITSAPLYRRATLAAALVLMPIGAVAVYSALGSPNIMPVSMNAETSGQAPPDGVEQTVADVEAFLEKNPRNGRGWELLAPVYMRLGRFEDAVRARRNALEIFGPDAARLADLGEAVYMAAGGVVTPVAKDLFPQAEAADPQDVMAQYYLGLSAKQEGRRDEAVKRWRAIIDSAPQGAEFLPMIKNALAQVDQTDHDGDAIEGTVERLAERLKQSGSDVSGWVQLARSYRVLGKHDKVAAAIADARAALAGTPESLQQFNDSVRKIETEAASGSTVSDQPMAKRAASPQQTGPSAEDMAAASKMTSTERAGMIEGMVSRLAQRMAENGSDVEGWLRLIRAYSVLGQRDKALAAATSARAALAGNSDNLRRIGELTNELGLEGS